jgi:hypothetical protein
MRKIFVIFLLVLVPLFDLSAQKSRPYNIPLSDDIPFHFGYGVNFAFGQYTIRTNNPDIKAEVQKPVYGFELQLLANKRLLKTLSLRALPSLSFVSKNVEISNLLSGDTISSEFQSIFIGCPILLKYKASRLNNVAPYLIAGVNPRYDLAAGVRIPQKVDWIKVLTRGNLYAEAGTGLDIYLPTTRLGLEVKYSVGIFDNKSRNILPVDIKETNIGQFNEYVNRLLPYILVFSVIIEQ